jgi:ribulose kinase
MTTALDRADPEELAELYASLRLALAYHHAERIVDVEVDPIGDRVDELRVRGGTHTLTTRLDLAADGGYRTL